MPKKDIQTGEGIQKDGKLPGWLGLAAGLVLIWTLAYVILPWAGRLPLIKPVMQAIEVSDVDAGAYWYTQSEETAIAQMYVRHAVDGR